MELSTLQRFHFLSTGLPRAFTKMSYLSEKHRRPVGIIEKEHQIWSRACIHYEVAAGFTL